MTRLARSSLLALSLAAGAGCGSPSGSDLRVVASILPPGNPGARYSAAVSTTGGQAPVALSVSQGELPAGVALSAAGALWGTPAETGSFRFTVSAKDAAGATATAGFTLEIFSNAPPHIATDTLPDGLTGAAYWAGVQVDGGQGPVQWSLVSGALPSGISLSAPGGLSGTPVAPGTSSFELEVDDAHGQIDRRALTLTIRTPLAIATSALPDGYTDAPYSLALQASGGQAPLAWSLSGGALPDGLALSSSGGISGTSAVRGRWAPAFLVTDAAGQTASVSLGISVYLPPALATPNLPDGALGAPYASALATSGGKGPLSFRIGTGALPPGLSLDGASLSGTPTAPGPASFSIEVTDANGRTAVRFFTMTIFSGLAVTSSWFADGYTGTAYSDQLSAAGGTPPYGWTSSALPAGLTLSSSGALSGTPAAPGTTSVTFTATDALGQTASRNLALAIYSPPSATTASLPDGYAGESYSQPLQASGGKAPLTWTLSSGALPPGFTLSSGILSGSPASASSASFSAVVTDANGISSAPRALSLTVLPALSVTTASLVDGYIGQAYSEQLAPSGGKAPYSWMLLSGSLPAGVSLSGTGAITGTPSQASSATFSVQVADANGHLATSVLSLTTYAPVAIGTAALPDAYSSAAYSAPLSATGGKAPITWTVAVGSLPSGLSLSTSGAISGTPATYAATSTFTARAADKNGTYADRQLAISVYSLPAITTASLPAATVNTSYDQTATETGGRSPLTWSVASGALPAGLTLDSAIGRIFGTPTAVGTASFTLQVADLNGRSAQKALSILVTTPQPALLKVANWNLDWFGDPSNGPTNDDTQYRNVRGVIADAGFDLWGLVEVADAGTFNQLIANLPGYSGFLANDTRYVDGGTIYYSPSEQKVGVLYNTAKLAPINAQLILTANQGDFAGRPPLRVNFHATVDGFQKDLTVIVLHMKAFSDTTSYNERYNAGRDLKSYLDSTLPTQTVLVIGDWNDDVDQSITKVDGGYLDTPYRALVNDSADYTYVTAPLSAAGIRSTVNYPDFIDHQLATNEAAALLYGTPEAVRPDLWAVPITSYGTTTTDHYPVVGRYDLR